MAYKLLSLIILYFLSEVQCAKILAVFPVPSISHQVVFRSITQELARRGHDVTIITPDPAFPKGKTPANIKEIDVHDISYGGWASFFQKNYKVESKISKFSEIKQGSLLLAHIFNLQMEHPEVKKLVEDKKNNKFDLILIESVVRPAISFSYIFKAPVILVSSLGAIFSNFDIIGAPTHPTLYPSSLRRRLYNLTLSEKIDELYTHFMYEYANYLNEEHENKMLQQIFGPEIPTLKELYNNVDMLFLNIHPIWADNQPVPTSVVYMGGIHQVLEKELPKDLKTYLDSSKNGVIYVSFGTNVLPGMIKEEKKQIIFKVLSQLPYDVLLKWNEEDVPLKAPNIKVSKWFPQSDLLRHPKIKLFVTQAGLQSTDEAITAGVPLVSIPMLGDQWFNAEKYVKHGIGVKLDIVTLNEQEFKKAIETVINDDSYRQNVVKLRELMRDQPETPLQRVMWWTDYVLRHGGAKQLRAPGANISYAQYFEVELLLVLFSVVVAALLVGVTAIVIVVKLVSSFLCSSKKNKKSKSH